MANRHTKADNKTAKQQAQAKLQLQKQAQQKPIPYWAEPLPLPPHIDFVGQVKEDMKALALIAAIKQVATDRDESIQSQMDIWNHGRGRN